MVLTNDNQRVIKAGELLAKTSARSDSRRKSGNRLDRPAQEYLASRTFVGAIAEQWLLTVDPDVYSLWHSSQAREGGYNLSGISNEQIDKILEEARRTVERTRRTQLYSEFQEIWAEECPSVLLSYPEQLGREQQHQSYTHDPDRRQFSLPARNPWYVKTKAVPATQ